MSSILLSQAAVGEVVLEAQLVLEEVVVVDINQGLYPV
jgi:hypothetical protein